ncbi:hypothetical protein ACOACQ_17610 [Nocardioides sp. CPCC 206347]
MSTITALLLAALFAAVVGAFFALAPSEDEMTPLLDQVAQRVEASR